MFNKRFGAAPVGQGTAPEGIREKLEHSGSTASKPERQAWRKIYKVHPAADVFPMMSDEELAALGQDIKTNGLIEPITVDGDRTLLDGRNRLEAMERAGVEKTGGWCHEAVHQDDPVAYIISKNIRRRHLTKQQQADLIVEAHRATPVSRQDGGKLAEGRPVNQVKAAAVASAKAMPNGPSKRTVERAIAKAEGRTPKVRTVEEVIAADEKRRATLAATKERKKAEEQARKELEALRTENMIAEVMGLLTPHLSREEINRVFKLCIALNWPSFIYGFTYEGQKYGGEHAEEDDDAENGASTLPPISATSRNASTDGGSHDRPRQDRRRAAATDVAR